MRVSAGVSLPYLKFHFSIDSFLPTPLELLSANNLLQECETKYEQQCSTTYEEVCEEALPQYTSYGAPTGYGAPKQCKQVRQPTFPQINTCIITAF